MHAGLLKSSLMVACLLGAAPVSIGADNPGNHTTGKEVGKKIDDAAQAIRDYSVGQREEALESAKDVLAGADTRLEQLEDNLNRNWDRMSESARKHALETLKTLRRQRQDLSQSYGELKRSSSNAWDEVKGGFAKSYGALRDSFARAAREF